MKTLDRYLLREVGLYLLGGLAIALLTLLVAALYEVLAPLLQRGADPWVIAQYLAFQVPEALTRGLPLAYLFALLLVLARLAEASELKALLASGIPRSRVLWPLLAAGGALFLLGLWAEEELVPASLAQGNNVLETEALSRPRAFLVPGSTISDAFGRVLYVGTVAQQSIGEVRVLTPDSVMEANQGRFRDGVLELSSGLRVTYGRDERPRTVIRFQRAQLPLTELAPPIPGGLSSLSLSQLHEQILQYRAQGIPYAAQLTAFYRRFADPAASLAFALFAVGLAFYLLQGSRPLGLVGIAVLTFAYYALWSVGRVMGEEGALPAWLAAWGPDLFYSVAGSLLFLGGRR